MALLMRFIIYAIAMVLVYITAVHAVATATGYSGTMGFAVLSDYFDEENGVQLYEFADDTNTTVKEAGHLNLGKFMRDILKANGNSDILVECANSAGESSFSKCVEDKQASDPALKSNYDSNMNHIKSAIEIAQENGMDYMSVPFVRDFVE